MTVVKITPEEQTNLTNFILLKSGIVLDNTKGYLIESRLRALLMELGCLSYQDLLYKAQNDKTIQQRIIDAISTNETSFFRDRSPFELLQNKILPSHINQSKAHPKTIRIWSAACSTGQEVYSLAILLNEHLPNVDQWHIQLLGTDISDKAIAQARAGCYNQIEIQRGLTETQQQRYFEKINNAWHVKSTLSTMAQFQKLNLCDAFAHVGKFDIIFCRNVAIYFAPEMRKSLFNRLATQLMPNGILVIGSTESLLGISDHFERQTYFNSVYYTLKNSAKTKP